MSSSFVASELSGVSPGAQFEQSSSGRPAIFPFSGCQWYSFAVCIRSYISGGKSSTWKSSTLFLACISATAFLSTGSIRCCRLQLPVTPGICRHVVPPPLVQARSYARARNRVHVVPGRRCEAVAPVPHSCCVSCLFRRHSGHVIRLPYRQRHPVHHHFRCVALCRSTRIVEGLVWDRTPAPPPGALLARITGPGRRCAEVCVGLVTKSPFSRGVSWRRSARPRHRCLHNSCCIRGAIFALSYCGARTFVRVFNPHGQSVIVKMHNGVRIAIFLFKQITACVDCAFYGLCAMLEGCTYLSIRGFTMLHGLVHLLCTACLTGAFQRTLYGNIRWRPLQMCHNIPCCSSREYPTFHVPK